MSNETKFVYVVYIRTTAEKLWDALTRPEFIRQYWFDITQESDWTPGAAWTMKFSDGRTLFVGSSGTGEPTDGKDPSVK